MPIYPSSTPDQADFRTFGERVAEIASATPDLVAVRLLLSSGQVQELTWSEYEKESNRLAHGLAALGLGEGSFVAVALPNSLTHFVVSLAVWKLGGCVFPMSPLLPTAEMQKTIEQSQPSLVIWAPPGVPPGAVRSIEASELVVAGREEPDTPLPRQVSCPGYGLSSGGSTGHPKVIVWPRPWGAVPGEFSRTGIGVGMRPEQRQLVGGALFYDLGFAWAHRGLFESHEVTVLERFDAARAIDAITKYGIQFMAAVPTMLSRMLAVLGIEPSVDIATDVSTRERISSVESIVTTSAPSATWLKRALLGLFGPARLWDIFGSNEGTGLVIGTGFDWCENPRALGRPWDTDVRIRKSNGEMAADREVGELYLKARDLPTPLFHYRGTTVPPQQDVDGFVHVGDLAWQDANGYLFLADRSKNVINSGGVNIYPAEIEAVLSGLPAVDDVVVIGLEDRDWGQKVHAIVATSGDPVVVQAQLTRACSESLAAPKRPKSWQFVSEIPRDGAGKLTRSALMTILPSPRILPNNEGSSPEQMKE